MDGILRRRSANLWEGTLGGYTVQVSHHSDGWFAAVINAKPRQITRCVLKGQTLQLAAQRARQWIENQGESVD